MKSYLAAGILMMMFFMMSDVARSQASSKNESQPTVEASVSGSTLGGVTAASGGGGVNATAPSVSRVSGDKEIDEKSFRERVKKRQYPGGIDEEPLKLQSQMPSVSRKMGPSVELEIPEPADPHQESD